MVGFAPKFCAKWYGREIHCFHGDHFRAKFFIFMPPPLFAHLTETANRSKKLKNFEKRVKAAKENSRQRPAILPAATGHGRLWPAIASHGRLSWPAFRSYFVFLLLFAVSVKWAKSGGGIKIKIWHENGCYESSESLDHTILHRISVRIQPWRRHFAKPRILKSIFL